jgi:RNA polymerase sigma factor (sigma-70 family)
LQRSNDVVSEISQGKRKMQQNDPVARGRSIEELFERHAETLFAFLRLHTPLREDAEDILVETFMVAMADTKFAYLCEADQTAWLWRVARNKVVDVFRKASVRHNASLEQAEETICEDETRDPEQMALRQDEAREVNDLLQHLSAQQQEVLRLRFGDGLRCSEIALILGKREPAVRTMLSRAMNLLRQLYFHRSSTSSHSE